MTKLALRKNIDSKKVIELSEKLSLDELLVRILLNRDIDSEDKIKSFLYGDLNDLADPYLYTNMDKGVVKIQNAIDNDQKILIYGDYDCDGIGAIAIMYLAFKAKGIITDFYIPSRADEGYGLNTSAIDKIKKDFDPQLIITVDCGITSVKEVDYIKSLGMDVIITDHHRCGEIKPDCIIINPCQDENLTPLCGAGVVHKLITAIFGKEIANNYLDICAISTVADIVPLTGDNRIIAKYGIQAIRKGNCRRGIKQLLITANTTNANISTYDVAYKIVPRLNASGRLATAYNSLNLLIEEDLTAINIIAEELEMQNQSRQKINTAIYEEAKELLKGYDFGKYKIIILENDSWNEGVIGIVAAKIAEEFNKPAILLTLSDGKYKGSARSIAGINIHGVLVACSNLLLKFGGHAMAAGMSINCADFLEFREKANQFVLANYAYETMDKTIKYDFALPIKAIDYKLFDRFMLLEPYGQSNPRPVFLNSNLTTVFTQIGKTNHLKMKTKCGDLVAFNSFQKMDYYNKNIQNILYSPEKNFFNGKEYNQFKVKEILSCGNLPDEDILFGRYIATFCSFIYQSDAIPFVKNGEKPILYVAFNGITYKQFLSENKDLNEYIYSAVNISDTDSIVLSPDKDFPFEYYNKIVVLDEISAIYEKFLHSKIARIEVKPLNNSFSKRVNIECLREDYIFFSASLKEPYVYTDEHNLYCHFVQLNYSKKYEDFLAALYTFIDVGLLIKSKNDILITNNKKVDLNTSKVYQYLTRE